MTLAAECRMNLRDQYLDQFGFLMSKRAFIVEINEDQPNENKQRLFSLSLRYKGVSHQHLRFGRASKAGRGVGRLYSSKKGKA